MAAQAPRARRMRAASYRTRSTTARASIAAPCPTGPRRSAVLALTLTWPGSMPSSAAMRATIAARCGAKRGAPSGTRLIADSNDPVETPVRSGYPTSIAGATASIVSQVVANYPVEVDRLTQDEKMEIMDILNRKGVFLLKGSVSHVAQTLHSSEASIYRYLGKLNNK